MPDPFNAARTIGKIAVPAKPSHTMGQSRGKCSTTSSAAERLAEHLIDTFE
uniref:Uncharacterized protein n=1 Tax=Pseudomonas aeruginosa TaxID=287 RepID=A0A6C0L3E2_PSEAI|nr:hypothetical protein [Pseudomonas aeruginosa]